MCRWGGARSADALQFSVGDAEMRCWVEVWDVHLTGHL